MKIYKVIPLPGRMVVGKKEKPETVLKFFEDTIAKESLGGWELVTSISVDAVKKIKRLRSTEEPYNLLVFSKEDNE